MKTEIISQNLQLAGVKKQNGFLKFLLSLSISILFLSGTLLTAVSAEGVSASAYLSVSSTILNIGKTFTVTLKVSPSSNISITTFESIIKFDYTKFELVKADGKPSSVPSGFDIRTSNQPKDEVVLLGEESSGGPIKTRGDTSLVILTFKVRDSAVAGSKTTFSFKGDTVLNISGVGSVPADAVYASLASPKTVTIGPKLETNAFLSSLSIEGAVISPKFDKNVMNYKASVPKEVTSVKVTTQKESSKATVSVTGTSSLDYGDNTVTVTVTAQDTDVARRYKITVTRAFPETTPTEAISSQEESSDTISVEPTITEIIATPTVEATPEPTPIAPTYDRQLNFWKILTVVFAGLFVITLCILIWVAIDRNSMRDVKIRRL